MLKCRICGNSGGNRLHVAHEMMFGRRDAFEYLECAQCGCLQIADVPANLSDYYPADYYSLQKPSVKDISLIKKFLKRCYTRQVLGQNNLIGRIYLLLHGVERRLSWFRHINIGLESPVLEVGSGIGQLLLKLSDFGFSDLTGIDPFIDSDVCYKNGVRILKRRLNDMDGSYDLVMLHHSFEHMQHPLDALLDMHRILRPGGSLLIRIPVADSYAWRNYSTDWVQLDAPRHLFLHTRESMKVLAEKSGFAITEVVCDSTGFQFYGSEQYRRGIPLRDPRSYSVSAENSIFSKEDIKGFEERAKRLNEEGQGDQACFYLRRD